MIKTALLGFLLLVSAARADQNRAITEASQSILQQHADARVLLIGELHGTEQIPELLTTLIRDMDYQGELLVGLEISSEEQSALDRYLRSDGSPAARLKLLAGAFWQTPHARSDGRRSLAMARLIETLRQLREQRGRLSLLAYDVKTPGVDRDRSMALRLRDALLANPQARMLVLSGNYHARLSGLSHARSNGRPIALPRPMAEQLMEALEPSQQAALASVDVAARGGAYWGCAQVCGPQSIPERASTVSQAVVTSQLIPQHAGYHLRVELPRFSYSPPVELK